MKIKLLFGLTILLSISVMFAQKLPKPSVAPTYLKKIMKHEGEYLKSLSAKTKSNLEIIKEIDEKKYLELLSEARFSSVSWSNFFEGTTFEKNNTILEYEIESQALAMQYKSGKGNKDQIKKDLQFTLELLLDLKEERRQAELKALEEKISELKKSINERKKNKKEIIRRRMMDMLDESEYFEWE